MEKLKEIQQQLKVPKAQYNKFRDFYYRSCEDILEAVKPLLGDATLTMADDIVMIGDRYYVKATVAIATKDGNISTSAYAREPLEKKGMDEPQVTGTASSYARKYALNGLFCIDDEKDADTNEYQKKQEVPKTEKIKSFDKSASTKTTEKKPAPTREEILDLCFFEYETVHQDYLADADGKIAFDKDKLALAIVKHFKILPSKIESIKTVVDTIKPEEVAKLVE